MLQAEKLTKCQSECQKWQTKCIEEEARPGFIGWWYMKMELRR
jgi:hypothetical protein